MAVSLPTPAAAATAPNPQRDAALIATVHQFRQCLKLVPQLEKRVLAARTGLGGNPIQSPAVIGARLRLSPAQVSVEQTRGSAALVAAAHRGACATRPAPVTSRPVRNAPQATGASAGGWSRTPVVAALAAVALCSMALVLLIARELRT